MNTAVAARYSDGRRAGDEPVTLTFLADGTVEIRGETFARTEQLAAFRPAAPLAGVPYFVRLPDRALLEIPRSPEADAALGAAGYRGRLHRRLEWLEARAVAAAVCTLLLVAGVALTVWFGLPAAAARVARSVPADLERRAGNFAFDTFSQQVGGGVTLPAQDQIRAARILGRLTKARGDRVKAELIFRNLNVPNAFAFPGGKIVVGESLYLACLKEPQGEDLFAAILAHELAHVESRHGLQLILRNSGALVAMAVITGDLSSLTAFSATLPILLIQQGYAREFETEADTVALGWLRAAGINPSALPAALQLLEKLRPKSGPDFTYLSTHPSTDDRIKLLKAAAAAPAAPPAKP